MNVKQGDLAYLVYGGPNTGRMFEILRFRTDHPEFGCIWRVRSSTPCQTWDADSRLPLDIKTEFDCPDAWLRPITGLPVTDDITEEVTA